MLLCLVPSGPVWTQLACLLVPVQTVLTPRLASSDCQMQTAQCLLIYPSLLAFFFLFIIIFIFNTSSLFFFKRLAGALAHSHKNLK